MRRHEQGADLGFRRHTSLLGRRKELYPVFERAILSIGVNPAEAKSMAKMVRFVYTDPERWKLFEDVIPTLDLLSSRDWMHVLLSNHVPELREITKHLGLEHRLAKIFNSAETGYEKPHPKAFQVVLDYLPYECIKFLVGDSMKADIEGVEAVGILAILIRRPHGKVKYFCDNLGQLPDLLESVLDSTF